MIKFNEENLNENYVKELLDTEALNIQVLIAYQDSLKEQVLDYSKNFIEKFFYNSDKKYFSSVSNFFNDLSKIYQNLEWNYENCNQIQKNFEKLKLDVSAIENNEFFKCSTLFNNYNYSLNFFNDTLLKNTNEIQSLMASCHKINILNEIVSENGLTQRHTSDSISPDNSNLQENALVISEKLNRVTLPFTITELNKLLQSNPEKYSSLEDIILQEFTRPLKYYKNSTIARFKEAFKLIREREHGSLKHAIDLALELTFNYHLHPAIISACKNLNELDVYLSCLEYDELEDFKFFKIIYDVLPRIQKSGRRFSHMLD